MIHTETNNWNAYEMFSSGIDHIASYKENNDYNKLIEARRKLNSAVNEDPNFERAIYHLALVNDLLGDHRQAINLLEPLLDNKSSFRLEALYTLGFAFFHQYISINNSYEKSIEYFKLSIEESGKLFIETQKPEYIVINLLSYSGLANVYAHFSIIKPKEIIYLEKTIKLYDLVNNELELYKSKLEDNGIKEILWLINNALGVALMYAGRKDRANKRNLILNAIDHLNMAEKFNKNHKTRSNIGSAFLFLSDLTRSSNPEKADLEIEKSIGCYFDTLKLHKDYDFAYYRLARLMRRKGYFTQANFYIKNADKFRNELTEEQIELEKSHILKENRFA